MTSGAEPGALERIADTDTVWRNGDRLVVRAPHPMVSWRVGKYRRTAVWFRDRRYAVVEAGPADGEHRYVLEPWAPLSNELAGTEIVYDAAYVLEREDDVRGLRAARRQGWALLPFFPVAGFLPKRVKTLLQRRFGLEPIGATRLSVLIELAFFVILLLYAMVGLLEGPGLTLVFVLLFDVVLRGSILVDDSFEPYGFWEWIIHPELIALLRRRWRR